MALSAGARLGPYEIMSFVAAGGMGEMYRARDTRLSRSVAIKGLPASFALEGIWMTDARKRKPPMDKPLSFGARAGDFLDYD